MTAGARSAFVRRTIAATLIALLAALSARAQEGGRWFETDALNAGLGPPPERLDRSTPQGALESFLDAAARDDFARAAHLLDLARIPEERQTAQGPELARKLASVIERRVLIDWADLPDRPDAVAETASSGDPMAGAPRRSLRLATLEIGTRPASLRLSRVKPGNAPAVWVFSPQTVENVPALHEIYGPGWFESRLPGDWLEETALGVRKWELAGLPAVIAAAGVAAYLVARLVSAAARRARRPMVRAAADAARAPLALMVAAALLDYVTASLLAFSAPITTFLSPALLIVIVAAVALSALRATDAALDFVTERFVGAIDDAQSADERSFYTSVYAARRIVVLAAVATAVGVVLMELHLFESLGMSLLASAGLVTVLLGIAGQAVLGNILSSLQIALAKPIRIGDSVRYEGDWAYVEAIYYTFVRLRTWDNRRLIAPVKHFVSHPFENWSMQDARMTRTFSLTLDHDADIAALRARFAMLAEEDEDVIDKDDAKTLVLDHGPEGVEVGFYATAADPTIAWNMNARLCEAMVAWVRDEHPEWWPRERIADRDAGPSARGAAAGRG